MSRGRGARSFSLRSSRWRCRRAVEATGSTGRLATPSTKYPSGRPKTAAPPRCSLSPPEGEVLPRGVVRSRCLRAAAGRVLPRERGHELGSLAGGDREVRRRRHRGLRPQTQPLLLAGPCSRGEASGAAPAPAAEPGRLRGLLHLPAGTEGLLRGTRLLAPRSTLARVLHRQRCDDLVVPVAANQPASVCVRCRRLNQLEVECEALGLTFDEFRDS